MRWLLLIIPGGVGVPTAVFLTVRGLVHRQTEPWRGEQYLTWFRAQKAAEHDEAVRAEIARLAAADRPKESIR